jgi:hypothetical protein
MLNLKFNSSFDDDYDSHFVDDVQTHKGTLASIFKKNQRYAMREIKLNPKTEEKTEVAEQPLVKDEEEIQFNSKLTWLTIPVDQKKEDLTPLFKNEYPSLSLVNTTCPKIRDGFKCSKSQCRFDHPETEDVQKIVSTMRSLKKRVVKDVLKLITTDSEENHTPKVVVAPKHREPKSRGKDVKKYDGKKPDENKQDVKPKSKSRDNKDKVKLCKFLQGCKFKATCKFAHAEDELVLNDCQFGSRCRFVKNVDGTYVNNNGKCLFLHPKETKVMYVNRTK